MPRFERGGGFWEMIIAAMVVDVVKVVVTVAYRMQGRGIRTVVDVQSSMPMIVLAL
jgi:hypothetical protein